MKFVGDDNFDDVRLNISEASSFYYETEPFYVSLSYS